MAVWTEEQMAAISHRDGAAIVSAAAGSGKTAVLVERILRLITDEENKMNADELAVVTFTNKAADELRQRLMSAVEQRERESRSEYLREQLIRLEDADISTISAFCLNILREYSALLGLSPDFSVAEQSETEVMKHNAMQTAMARLYGEFTDDEKDLLYRWFAEASDSGVEAAVSAYYEFTRNLPFAESWTAQQLDRYDNPERGFSWLVGKYKEKTRLAVGELYKTCTVMCDEAACTDGVFVTFSAPYLANAAALMEIADLFAPENESAVSPLLSFDGGRFPTKRGVDTSEVKQLRDNADDLLKKIRLWRGLVLTVADDCAGEPAAALHALTRLVGIYGEEYSLLKRGVNGVDFSDIEQMTLKLTEDDELCKKIAARYACIIVDEFQDSNDVQYEIFERISREGKNLFFVGDIKQSIYRFRGANPNVFAELLSSSDFKPLLMSNNFRSNRHVINAVNGIFGAAMTAERGGVDYDERSALREGATFYGESDADEGNKAELVITTAVSEPEYVAARIAKMLTDGFPVTDKDGTRRACKCADFAILLRSDAGRGKLYRDALARYGIPAAAKNEGEYTTLAEIDLVLNLLTIIDNPYNNTALTAVLMSPLYMLTAEEMAQIRLNCGGSLYTGVIKLADRIKSAERFLADYRRYRKITADSSVPELVRAIYDDGGLISTMSLQYKGEQSVANMRLLLTYTEAFTAHGGGTLSDFLVYINKTKRLSMQLTPASIQSGPDVVPIMSIHASKGLEFPICFVCETERPFNMMDSYPRILFDIELGIGLTKVDSEQTALIETLPHKAIAEQIREDTVSECMRLLYVALTRAREKLIVTAEGKLSKGALKAPPANSFLSWINEGRSDDVMSEEIIENASQMPAAEEVIPAETDDSADAELTARVCSELAEKYRYAALCEIPSKFTATELGVEHREDVLTETTEKVSVFPRKPSFMQPERRLSGKKAGDAYHKAMELLNFAGDTAEKQLSALLARGSLSQAEFDCIKPREIQGFLDSRICRRAVNAERVYKEFPVFAEIPLSEIISEPPVSDSSDNPIVQGVADMFFIENGSIVLIDYKTNRRATAAQLIETYSGQLRLYARILSETFGLPAEEAVLYSFELGEIKVAVK